MQKLKGRKIKYETKTLKKEKQGPTTEEKKKKKETANQKSCYGKRRKRRKKKGKRNIPPMAELQKRKVIWRRKEVPRKYSENH